MASLGPIVDLTKSVRATDLRELLNWAAKSAQAAKSARAKV